MNLTTLRRKPAMNYTWDKDVHKMIFNPFIGILIKPFNISIITHESITIIPRTSEQYV